jgi:exopolyphosphatase/guanosine-5'-triphosphate,3'-diphosphate pyrophosphatase
MNALNKSLLHLIEQDPALRHAYDLAREEDSEPEHCFHVTHLAHVLFAASLPCHGMSDSALRLLLAAALLHDTGYSISPESHHKGSRDLILQSELPGVSESATKIIACVARYHRGALPKADHKVYRDLDLADQARVRGLAALLRIADGLDRGHDAACCAIDMRRDGATVWLRIGQRFKSEIDIWGADRKRDLFEAEFGVTVRFEAHVLPAASTEES